MILVLHSYGGISGTESAKGLLKKDREAELKKGGINSIVYVAAFLLPLDASLKSFLGDLAPWIIFEVSPRSRVIHALRDLCHSISCPTQAPYLRAATQGEKMTIINADRIFYNDLPESGMDTLISSLKHQSKASFFTPLTYAAYQDVPVSYLLCENDNAIPFQAQQAMVGIGGPNVASHICAAGHMPMIQMPERVVNVIREAAGEVVA